MNTTVNTAAVAGTAAAGTSTRPAPTTLWQRAKHGWPARYPLVQFPNVPLLAAVAGLLVAGMAEGAVYDIARGTFFAGLAVWAWLELTAGVTGPTASWAAPGSSTSSSRWRRRSEPHEHAADRPQK